MKRSAVRSGMKWWSQSELRIYIVHCLVLLRIRSMAPLVNYHPVHPGDTADWPEDDLELLLAEGQRQVDWQQNELDRVHTRSQFLFTTGIAALALAATTFVHVKQMAWAIAPWSIAASLLVLSMLGMAVNLGSKQRFMLVDTVLLSRETPPIIRTLTATYPEVIKSGFDFLATRYLIYRKGTFYQLLGAVLLLILWVLGESIGTERTATIGGDSPA